VEVEGKIGGASRQGEESGWENTRLKSLEYFPKENTGQTDSKNLQNRKRGKETISERKKIRRDRMFNPFCLRGGSIRKETGSSGGYKEVEIGPRGSNPGKKKTFVKTGHSYRNELLALRRSSGRENSRSTSLSREKSPENSTYSVRELAERGGPPGSTGGG